MNNGFKFEIGDWVQIKKDYIHKEVAGKVFQITQKRNFSMTTVWSCEDLEYWVGENNLEPVQQKILIAQDKNNPRKVIARNVLTKNEAEAKCAPVDTFDFAVGAKLALDRLLNKEGSFKKEEKEPKYYNGKVVCVEYSGSRCDFFTVGKVYTVKDGFVISNTGNQKGYNSPYNRALSFEDLNRIHANDSGIILRFIEYKGEA